ncbi:hypothetical protein V22_33220 [Calycomorphotria hydatis]|uniref:Uncharacterized protein n=1 Tax=Calycomorphotria hydatis TaxID=2528027 RepID=A0A517TCG0_9PLAN|nr:hypothetical protein V22_33220 [Calycomorphotria hydatis]
MNGIKIAVIHFGYESTRAEQPPVAPRAVCFQPRKTANLNDESLRSMREWDQR